MLYLPESVKHAFKGNGPRAKTLSIIESAIEVPSLGM
jgi:hypothetical protein